MLENELSALQYFTVYDSQSNGALERLIEELWKMSSTPIFESKLYLTIWREETSYANWRGKRIFAGRVNLEFPYTIWFYRRLYFTSMLKFGQPGYVVQYRSLNSAITKVLPRTIFGYFVEMQRENALYRMFSPFSQNFSFCRVKDSTILRKETQLPLFSNFLDGIANRPTVKQLTEKKRLWNKIYLQNAFAYIKWTIMSPLGRKQKTKNWRD